MEKNISKFADKFLKIYNKNSDEGYIPEVDIEYPKNLHGLNSDLPFLSERKLKHATGLYVIFL